MSALSVHLELVDGDVLHLHGCERVTEGEEGALTLAFASDAQGLATLGARDPEGVTGTMTVTGPAHNTEYNCALLQIDGTVARFQLICLD